MLFISDAMMLNDRNAGNTVVEVTSSAIIKIFQGVDAVSEVQHLRGLYSLLSGNQIPNTDELTLAKEETVYLGPRAPHRPTTIERMSCLYSQNPCCMISHFFSFY